MTGGWAATNTLRDNVVTLDYYAKERHVDGPDCPACAVTSETLDALALVEAALAAAAERNKYGHQRGCPRLDIGTECTCGHDALAAALRAVREGR